MAQNQYIEILNNNKLLRTSEESKAFDKALAMLAQEADSNLLLELFLVFDDKCQHFEVMWGLVHYIERFKLEEELQAFAKAAPTMLGTAKEWATLYLGRLLHHESSRLYFKEFLPGLFDDQKEAIISFLQGVAENDKSAKELVDLVLG